MNQEQTYCDLMEAQKIMWEAVSRDHGAPEFVRSKILRASQYLDKQASEIAKGMLAEAADGNSQ